MTEREISGNRNDDVNQYVSTKPTARSDGYGRIWWQSSASQSHYGHIERHRTARCSTKFP